MLWCIGLVRLCEQLVEETLHNVLLVVATSIALPLPICRVPKAEIKCVEQVGVRIEF